MSTTITLILTHESASCTVALWRRTEEPRIPIEKLTEFYVSFGFTVLGDDPEYVFMEREPIK